MASPQKGGESPAHHTLKRAARLWAREAGYRICADEIRVPNSNYRADVAACKKAAHQSPIPGATALFECKQARSDFLKDHHRHDESLLQLRELNKRRARLEKQLGIHYPSLRQGDSLFAEFQSVDPSALQHDGYRRVTREIATLERRLFGKTKFDRMAEWRCADLLYLVCPEHLVQVDEIPTSWGLLTSPADFDLDDAEQTAPLSLVKMPILIESTPATRLALLQNIAIATSRRQHLDSQELK